MSRKSTRLYIGTSGWDYRHWERIFYPEDLSSKEKLRYFSQHFKTAEINYSFYHLPQPSTYQNWYSKVPADFVFSVKASRFITHIKRLKGVNETWERFLENTLYLRDKLGPILFQFPPSFKATKENRDRLENFLKNITVFYCNKKAMAVILQFAFEFRHRSWCDETIYRLLEQYNAAWVISDSPRYPKTEIITADFVYIRMHGTEVLFGSKYTDSELKDLAKKIKKWLKVADVYCYFNNDAFGYALKNAKELVELCKIR